MTKSPSLLEADGIALATSQSQQVEVLMKRVSDLEAHLDDAYDALTLSESMHRQSEYLFQIAYQEANNLALSQGNALGDALGIVLSFADLGEREAGRWGRAAANAAAKIKESRRVGGGGDHE